MPSGKESPEDTKHLPLLEACLSKILFKRYLQKGSHYKKFNCGESLNTFNMQIKIQATPGTQR